ncbi:hypothetical protein [Spirosoma sp.]|nr:hypothetical protein [Spirosoma sp.]MBN8823779.1 hypothetical protein [Spirosoma sp.]
MHNLEGNLKDITMDNISKFVSYLLIETNYTIEQIAIIASVSVDFVKCV